MKNLTQALTQSQFQSQIRFCMRILNLTFVFLFISLPVSAVSLRGHWKTECKFVPPTHSGVIDIEFKNRIYKVLFSLYTDSLCKNLGFDIALKGKYQAKESVFNHRAQIVLVTLRSEDVVVLSNKNHFCGISDWVADAPRKVQGKVCEPFIMPRLKKISYDRFELDEGALTFGGFPRVTYTLLKERPPTTDRTWVFRLAP